VIFNWDGDLNRRDQLLRKVFKNNSIKDEENDHKNIKQSAKFAVLVVKTKVI